MKTRNDFISFNYLILLFVLIISACQSSQNSGMTTITLQIPNKEELKNLSLKSKSSSKVKEMFLGVPQNSFANLNCFYLLINAPNETSFNSNRCYKSDGTTFAFGYLAGPFIQGQSVSIQVPSGSNRSIYAAGVYSATGSCDNISPFLSEYIGASKTSNPVLLGSLTSLNFLPNSIMDINIPVTTNLDDIHGSLNQCTGPILNYGDPASYDINIQNNAKYMNQDTCVPAQVSILDKNGHLVNMNNRIDSIGFQYSGDIHHLDTDSGCAGGISGNIPTRGTGLATVFNGTNPFYMYIKTSSSITSGTAQIKLTGNYGSVTKSFYTQAGSVSDIVLTNTRTLQALTSSASVAQGVCDSYYIQPVDSNYNPVSLSTQSLSNYTLTFSNMNLYNSRTCYTASISSGSTEAKNINTVLYMTLGPTHTSPSIQISNTTTGSTQTPSTTSATSAVEYLSFTSYIYPYSGSNLYVINTANNCRYIGDLVFMDKYGNRGNYTFTQSTTLTAKDDINGSIGGRIYIGAGSCPSSNTISAGTYNRLPVMYLTNSVAETFSGHIWISNSLGLTSNPAVFSIGPYILNSP